MKTRKIYSKSQTRKNYKTSTMTIKPDHPKKNVNFFDSYKTPCINAAKSRLRKKISRDK
jgi:hypothetical protein